MQSGKLRHHIELFAEQSTRNDVGEEVVQKTSLGTRRCEVITSSQDKDVASDQERPFSTKKFRLRWFAGYLNIKSAVFNGQHLELVSIENVGERNRELIMLFETL